MPWSKTVVRPSLPKGTKTAEHLKEDFWLYVVYNCGSQPDIIIVQDPVQLGWEPLVKVEHYHAFASKIKAGGEGAI